MNFTNVRGYNAYAQFSAKIRETVMRKEPLSEPESEQDISHSTYSEPIDVVTISVAARNASASLLSLREDYTQTELTQWIRESGTSNGILAHRMSGQQMGELLTRNGITLEEDEVYDINIDVWSAVSVAGRNAEKARAIQNLLNSTPSGINWGFLLQRLPVDR